MSNLSGFVKRIRDIMRNDAGINGDAQRIEQIAWMLFLKVYDAKEQDWEINDDDYESIIPEECRWISWAHDDRSGSAMTGDSLLNFVNNTLFPTLKGLEVTPDTPIKKSIVKTTFEDANQYMKDGVLLRQVINIIDELDLSDYEESHAFGEIYESILRELQSAGSSGEFYTPRAVTEFMAKMIQPQIGERFADFACGTGGFLTSWLKELAPKVSTTEDQEAFNNSIYGIEKKQFPYMLCITNMLLHNIDVPQIFHDNSLIKDVLDYTEDDQFDVILMNPPFGGNEKSDVKNHFPADLASSETADLFMSVIMYRLKKNGRAAVILPDGFLYGADNAKINIKKKLINDFNLHTIIRMPGSVFSPYTSIATNILFFDKTKKTEQTWFYRLDMPEGYKHFSKTKPMKLEHFQEIIDWWLDRKEIIIDDLYKAKAFSATELSELGFNLDQCGYPREDEEIVDPFTLIDELQEETQFLTDAISSSLRFLADTLSDKETLDDTVPHSFGRLSEITAKFPERFKYSILQRTLQGDLVPFLNSDDTVQEFFGLLQQRKNELIRNGEIRKEKPISIEDEIKPSFEIPSHWMWAKVSDCVSVKSGLSYNKENLSTKSDLMIRVLRGGNILDMDYVLKSDDVMIASEFVKPDLFLKKNTIITPAVTSLEHIGKMGRIKEDLADTVVGGFVLMLLPHLNDDVFAKYLLYVFSSRYFRDCCRSIVNKSGQAFYNLSRGKMLELLLPLPPYSEQKRIVEKLEVLLPQCENLI